MLYDKIVIGAGLYGLYAARYCGLRGEHVLVLEKDTTAFTRATTINQARVHMGYHYPRSLSTAKRSASYFERFIEEFQYCINQDFEQIYATSFNFSWTNAEAFRLFCDAANIPCEPIVPERYFNSGMCEGAFLTREYTYDAALLRTQLLKELDGLPNVQVRFSAAVTAIQQKTSTYKVTTCNGKTEETPFLVNAAYASVNEILSMLEFDLFNIKYELCEMILCEVNSELKHVGLTVMDGPFFSLMPFGYTGLHSLTSVSHTPHITSTTPLPTFSCQSQSTGACSPKHLANCNNCPAKPKSAWPQMRQMAEKYILPHYRFQYKQSLYSMKPILKISEVDDSRPTLVRLFTQNPTFVSVLSGKINTVYDLEEIL